MNRTYASIEVFDTYGAYVFVRWNLPRMAVSLTTFECVALTNEFEFVCMIFSKKKKR